MLATFVRRKSAGYAIAMGGIAAVTALAAPFHETLNDTTVALAYLLVVLLVATAWGSWPASLASAVGVLCFNFFFLPPVYTLTIADPQNWVALAAFLVTAVTAGQLSELAKRRAAEAEAVRTGNQAGEHPQSEPARGEPRCARHDRHRRQDRRRQFRHRDADRPFAGGPHRHRLLRLLHRADEARALYREVLRDGFVRIVHWRFAMRTGM